MNWKTMLVTCALSGSCYAVEPAEVKASEVEATVNETMSVFILKAQSAG